MSGRAPLLGLLILASSISVSACEFFASNETAPKEEPAPPTRYNVIPRPRALVERDDELRLGPEVAIAERGMDPDLDRVATYLAARLRSASGWPVPVGSADVMGSATIELSIDPAIPDDEGYVLDVTPSHVELSARTARGLFYGAQTIRQLLPAAIDGSTPGDGVVFTLPAVHIEDAPRFSYRGMHLDVSRHFFSVDSVKRYLDLMALYKMNTFHWHLTDDQGWRVEIKKYPKLTEIGSNRKETVVGRPSPAATYDGMPYGGFYTQDQVRDVVAYAHDRFISVMPEIETPGHTLAALAAYPELACTPGPFETATTWGVFDDVLCPSDTTFQFLTDVLGEIATLFPDAYVHVGGDEVPDTKWAESPVAQAVVAREGLGTTADLETYFMRRAGEILGASGRKLVGWDEIADHAKIDGATVMSWRGTDTGIAAAAQGYPVIMTPIAYCYFDQVQSLDATEPLGAAGYLPLDKVYSFEPAPDDLGTSASLVIGGQGNVWTEYIASGERVEYMVFPRMLALSEALWSPREVRNYPQFLSRLTANAKHLDALGVNYAKHFEAP